ncbi:hypothetical protein ACFCWV_33740 [Streptomyces sp. NPDC056341]|uniref:hypothetical protein n=1 Tax=Streptomyces sp. NPDC056341 TaxID=3345788 RepID=UPI0035D9D563
MKLPPAATSVHGPGRRTVLRGLGGTAALGAGIPLLGAFSGSASGSSDPNTVTLGSGPSWRSPAGRRAATPLRRPVRQQRLDAWDGPSATSTPDQ